MNRAFKVAEAPNQEESQLGCGVSNSRNVYIRIGRDFYVELPPDKAVQWAQAMMQAAHMAVARRSAS